MKKTNRRISDLFYNNRFVLVFSIVAAIAIWLVAAVEFTEDIGRKLDNIGITITDNHRNFKAYNGPFSVDVNIKGKKYIVNSDDVESCIAASASSAKVSSSGYKTLDVEVSSTDDLLVIEDYYPRTIEVYFDIETNKEFKIEPEITFDTAAVPDGYHMSDFRFSNAYTVKVTGPETEINKIEKVVARANLDGNHKESLSFKADIVIVSKDGSELKYVTADLTSVEMTADVYKRVSLPVTCSFSNTPAFYLDKNNALPFAYSVSPATVTVGISEDRTDSIESIELSKNIDFSEIKPGVNTFTFEAGADSLSGAVLLDGTENFIVNVNAVNVAEKQLEPSSNVTVTNVPEGIDASLIKLGFDSITVVGTEPDISSVTSEDLILTADFSDIDDNATDIVTVPVRISGDKCWAYGDYTATFSIS